MKRVKARLLAKGKQQNGQRNSNSLNQVKKVPNRPYAKGRLRTVTENTKEDNYLPSVGCP